MFNVQFADKTRFGETCRSNKRRTSTVSGWIEHISDTTQSHVERAHESALCLFKLWPCSRYTPFHIEIIHCNWHMEYPRCVSQLCIRRSLAFIINFNSIFLRPNTGNHDWGQDKSTGARRCPMCLEVGPVVTLCMGCEPAFYVDSGPPTYAFNPCGHMATEKTVKYVSIAPPMPNNPHVWLNKIEFIFHSFADIGQMLTFPTEQLVFKRSVRFVRRRSSDVPAIFGWYSRTT